MAGDEGAQGAKKEPNLYLRTLQDCRDNLIPTARDDVYAGQGNPGSSIAAAISNGGWECDKATDWVGELLEHTRKVMPAFDNAIGDVSAAMATERGRFDGDDTVPEHDPHGLAWGRTWHNIQRLNSY